MPDAIVERDDHIMTITMNRPERYNALSGEMLIRMYDAYREADADPDVRVIIVTGAEGNFCSGADLKRITTLGDTVSMGGRTYKVQYNNGHGKLDLKDANGVVLYGVDRSNVSAVDTMKPKRRKRSPNARSMDSHNRSSPFASFALRLGWHSGELWAQMHAIKFPFVSSKDAASRVPWRI